MDNNIYTYYIVGYVIKMESIKQITDRLGKTEFVSVFSNEEITCKKIKTCAKHSRKWAK